MVTILNILQLTDSVKTEHVCYQGQSPGIIHSGIKQRSSPIIPVYFLTYCNA